MNNITVASLVGDAVFVGWMVGCGVLLGMMLAEQLRTKGKESPKQDNDGEGGDAK